MTRTVVLVGIRHQLQVADYPANPAGSAAFEAFLPELVVKHGLLALAEEMSADGLKAYHATTTCARKVTKALGLGYLQVDPSALERAELRIPPAHAIQAHGDFHDWSERRINKAIRVQLYDAREREWLRRIQSFEDYPLGLICGSLHVASFVSLLRSNQFDVFVAHREWKPGTKARRRPAS